MLKPGIYEQVINKKIETELTSRDDIHGFREVIDKEEAPLVLSKYMAELIEKNLTQIKESKGDLSEQIEYINKLISSIESGSEEDNINSGEQLLAIINKKNSIQNIDSRIEIVRPETSIARSSLLTGSQNEPSMFTELKKEILSANKIDMLVSFIKWSGLVKIMDELETFTQNGGKLRIITTSYMGATDIKAVKELSKLLNTEIKVSYDTKRTRLHAKSYIFYRETGFTTAYVGSSNLSNAAMSSGLEWNIKVTAKDLPDTIQKINATFESYWNNAEFEEYGEDQSERLANALKAEKYVGANDRKYVFDIIPYSYQQQILDKLNAEREVRGNFKNLVVAATGTGKR